MFWQFFLLNIKPWSRTLLRRQLPMLFFVLPMFILLLSYTDFGNWTEYMKIFYLFMVTSWGILSFASEFALRIESHFINLVFNWNYKTLYTYQLSKYVLGFFMTLVYFLMYYLIVPMPLEIFLGCSFFSIGISICLGLFTIPYNNYSMDLFDMAKMRANSMKGFASYARVLIMIVVTAFLCLPIYFGLSNNIYWIYFGIGLVLTLLFPLWLKMTINKIISRKYVLIDSLSK
jgi:uncharacterized membrane protein